MLGSLLLMIVVVLVAKTGLPSFVSYNLEQSDEILQAIVQKRLFSELSQLFPSAPTSTDKEST